jgi:hypothetical protein
MKKIFWIETAQRFALSGRVQVNSYDGANNFVTGLSDGDVDPIQKWCEKHDCGVRTSFDTFKFRNKKEITMFLLRWA